MKAEHFAMKLTFPIAILLATLLVVVGPTSALAQSKESKPKPPPDEFKAIVNAIEEAYKAPFEVDEDILNELRKQYRDPKPEREGKIFREIRRLYNTTAEQEDSILGELRRAYTDPTGEQEARVFQVIRRNGQLPLGAISAQTQSELAGKLFQKLDRSGDGILQSDEMSDILIDQRGTWDSNRDGVISPAEYMNYYGAHLDSVGKRVASGELQIKLPKQLSTLYTPTPESSPSTPSESPRPVEKQPPPKAAELPQWFHDFDLNADGQVDLSEWRKVGKRISDFVAMDGNQDGFLEATELQQFLAQQSVTKSDSKWSR
jgi:Ca2+-binding EF-hand superfamily protein